MSIIFVVKIVHIGSSSPHIFHKTYPYYEHHG